MHTNGIYSAQAMPERCDTGGVRRCYGLTDAPTERRRRDLTEGRPGPIAPPGWPIAAALPAAIGALWLWWAAQGGYFELLVGGVPGTLLLATGLSNLLWAGDVRIFHFMSFGALLGVVLSFPAILAFGLLAALVLFVGSAVSFVAAGYLAVGQEPVPSGVPEPQMSLGMAARAAEDEFSMCSIVLTTWPLSVGSRAARIGRELEEALVLFDERGWLRDPTSYHHTPPPVEKVGRGDRHHRE